MQNFLANSWTRVIPTPVSCLQVEDSDSDDVQADIDSDEVSGYCRRTFHGIQNSQSRNAMRDDATFLN